MKKKPNKYFPLLLFVGIMFTLFFFLKKREPVEPRTRETPQSQLGQVMLSSPQVEPSIEMVKKPDSVRDMPATDEEATKARPKEFLLKMPFYSQAPLGKWDEFHEDMCEEASLLNAALYLLDKKLTKEEFESELEKMKKMEERELGVWKSTTIAETKKLIETYFEGKIKAKVIDNPTINDIEREVSLGNPTITPLAGREIGNPNFTPPGPVYHMLVVRGYDAQNFITNDVGTRKGEAYAYRKNVIMENIHDWNEKNIKLGEKKIIVLER